MNLQMITLLTLLLIALVAPMFSFVGLIILLGCVNYDNKTFKSVVSNTRVKKAF